MVAQAQGGTAQRIPPFHAACILPRCRIIAAIGSRRDLLFYRKTA